MFIEDQACQMMNGDSIPVTISKFNEASKALQQNML